MLIHTLKPWTALVKLHSDAESGNLAEGVFAIDLGAIATADPTTPKVYLDPDVFSAAPYATSDLQRLREDQVLMAAEEHHEETRAADERREAGPH